MALLDRIKEVADIAKESGQTLGKMGHLKIDMTKGQAQIGDLYARIGIKAYKLHAKRDLSHPDLDEMFAQVDELKKQFEHDKREFDDIELKLDSQNQMAAQSRLADIAEQRNPMDEEAK